MTVGTCGVCGVSLGALGRGRPAIWCDEHRPADQRKGDRHKEPRPGNRHTHTPARRQFVGVDGEGINHPDGRQRYTLLQVGEDSISAPISAYPEGLLGSDILDWLVTRPTGPLYVAYAFGYDTSQILAAIWHQWTAEGRGKALGKAMQAFMVPEKVIGPRPTGEGGGIPALYLDRGKWTYAIRWLKSKRLSVSRIPRDDRFDTSKHRLTFVVHDVFGFFSCSFVRACTIWGIGTDAERATMAGTKATRNDFSPARWAADGAALAAYCATECRWLGELMTTFRDTCAGAGIMPITWEGAGGMAAALLRSHQVPRPDHERLAAVEADARKAYYGGHFEVSRRGALEQVHAYDINSAYPAIYADLPCLDHGRWELVNDGDQAPADGEAMFTYLIYDQPDTPWPVFPFRISAGNIANRRQGRGWHPSCLVDLAANDPTTMLFPIRTWYYTRECNCRHFDWVGELFVERQRLGKALKGYPIKLGLNSLYGKFAQSVGHPTHATPIWATLITGWVRVQVDRVAQRHPDTCAMIATDAVYLVGDTAPELDCGAALGQWSHARYDDMVVCQPGYYWTRDGDATVSSHTRGVSKAADVDWATILDRATSLDVPLKVTMTRYHGWREAWHRGKPDLAGIWDDGTSDLVWGGPKRRWEGQVGLSHIGDMREESIPHKGLMGGDALHVEAAFGELWDDDLGLQFG